APLSPKTQMISSGSLSLVNCLINFSTSLEKASETFLAPYLRGGELSENRVVQADVLFDEPDLAPVPVRGYRLSILEFVC
nr:hypothetical protein [Tanacetum cinerariifolium]